MWVPLTGPRRQRQHQIQTARYGIMTPVFCASIASHAKRGCWTTSRVTGRELQLSMSSSSYAWSLCIPLDAAHLGIIGRKTLGNDILRVFRITLSAYMMNNRISTLVMLHTLFELSFYSSIVKTLLLLQYL